MASVASAIPYAGVIAPGRSPKRAPAWAKRLVSRASIGSAPLIATRRLDRSKRSGSARSSVEASSA